MTHKYATILNAIMDGKTIQVCYGDDVYNDIDENDALSHLSYCTRDNLRVKPDTLSIAGIAVLKPMTEKPELGQRYFYIVTHRVDGVGYDYWSDSKEDNQSLHNGMCWLTRDAAVNAAAAIKKLLMGG